MYIFLFHLRTVLYMFGIVHKRDRNKPSHVKQLNTLDNYLSLSAGNSFKKKEDLMTTNNCMSTNVRALKSKFREMQVFFLRLQLSCV